MRQSIQQRLYGVVCGAVKTAAVGAQFECDVTACYAPKLDQHGNVIGLAHSWLLTVSTPNPLVGLGGDRPDIAISVPVEGVLPPEALFENVATQLWTRVAEEKDKLLTKPAALGMDLSGVGK